MKKIVVLLSVLFQIIICMVANAQGQPACDCKLILDNSFQIVPMTQGPDVGVPPLYESNDAASPAIALPFHFCFYGQTYDSVYISNNGIVSFKQAIYTFDTLHRFPFAHDTVMIAPFWADANTLFNNGKVYYSITESHLAIVWDSLRYIGSDVDGWNYFQMIITNGQDPLLPDGNNISFCYPSLQWSCADASGGFSGAGGAPASIGINKGDGTTYAQINTISKPGYFYYGPFSPDNGVDWMTNKSFTFSSCVNGPAIAPVIYNYGPNCSTHYVCPCDTTNTAVALGAPDSMLVAPCDTVSFTGAFVCAVPGQTANLSFSCQGPLNVYAVDTFTSNGIDSIVVTVIPAFSDTGRQVLTLTATDPDTHLQSSITYTVVVATGCADSIGPNPVGIVQPSANNSFAVYPNPATQNITISVQDNTGNAMATLSDILGNQVMAIPLTGKVSDINIASLPKGMYFVKILQQGSAASVKKIIIQ